MSRTLDAALEGAIVNGVRYVTDPADYRFDMTTITFDYTAWTFDIEGKFDVNYNIEWGVGISLGFDGGDLNFITLFNDTDIGGDTYLASANVGTVSPLRETLDRQPEDFTISLSGVSQDNIALILSEKYLGRSAKAYFIAVDANQAVLGSILAFEGGMQAVTVRYGATPTIEIRCSGEMSDYNRIRSARYTQNDHDYYIAQQLGAGFTDNGFEFVDQLEDRELVWPAKEFFK